MAPASPRLVAWLTHTWSRPRSPIAGEGRSRTEGFPFASTCRRQAVTSHHLLLHAFSTSARHPSYLDCATRANAQKSTETVDCGAGWNVCLPHSVETDLPDSFVFYSISREIYVRLFALSDRSPVYFPLSVPNPGDQTGSINQPALAGCGFLPPEMRRCSSCSSCFCRRLAAHTDHHNKTTSSRCCCCCCFSVIAISEPPGAIHTSQHKPHLAPHSTDLSAFAARSSNRWCWCRRYRRRLSQHVPTWFMLSLAICIKYLVIAVVRESRWVLYLGLASGL